MAFRIARVVFLSLAPLYAAAPAAAGPFTWAFQGHTMTDGIPEVPIGTLATLDWTVDANQPNQCAIPNGPGIYNAGTVTLQMGSYVWQAGGFLVVGGYGSVGCAGTANGNIELRLTSWSGPSLGPLILLNSDFPASSYMTWSGAAGSAFPLAPPASAFLEAPLFHDSRTPFDDVGIDAVMLPIPEPSSLALIAIALSSLAAWRPLRDRARHVRQRAIARVGWRG